MHSECGTCHKLKAEIRSNQSLAAHAKCCDLLLQHLASQWMDRSVYWSRRARAKVEGDLLSLIMDGMDKSKWVLPRWGRTPKGADKLLRPVLHVSASLIHGIGACVFVTDDILPGGSNLVCEQLMLSIDVAWKCYRKRGRRFPLQLALQADNTVKEVRNQILGGSYLALGLRVWISIYNGF